MKNTSDEKEIAKKEKQVKQDRDLVLDALRKMLKSRGGRIWIWTKLTECHVFDTSFTGNSGTFFNEGERNVGLKLLKDVMEADPDAFTAMMKEFNNG